MTTDQLVKILQKHPGLELAISVAVCGRYDYLEAEIVDHADGLDIAEQPTLTLRCVELCHG